MPGCSGSVGGGWGGDLERPDSWPATNSTIAGPDGANMTRLELQFWGSPSRAGVDGVILAAPIIVTASKGRSSLTLNPPLWVILCHSLCFWLYLFTHLAKMAFPMAK